MLSRICQALPGKVAPMNKLVLCAAAAIATALTAPAAHANPIPACSDGQVRISDGWSDAASSHYGTYLEFSLTPGSAPCTLTGYPGVDQTGPDAPVLHADRTMFGFMGGLPRGTEHPPTLIVSSWQPQYALVEGRAVDEHGQDCPKYDELHVTAPDTTQAVTLPGGVACVLQIHPVGSGAPRPNGH
jgi:hypothetical protein